MKRISVLLFSVLIINAVWGSKLFLASDSIYYFPYPDGTASVSGTIAQRLELDIPTFVMIPDSCLSADAADPAHMSEYKVTIIGENAFVSNNYFTKITLPDYLERIDDMAFYGCSKMVIPSMPQTLTRIGSYAFFNCAKLAEINLPNIEKLGQQAFMRCSQLRTVVLGDNLDTLPRNVFSADALLESIELGSGLKCIETNALSRCYALASITCHATTPPTMDSKALQYDPVGSIVLHVPCNTEKAYSAAEGWKQITHIEATQEYAFSVSAADDLGFINIIHKPNGCNDYLAEIEAVANVDYLFDRWNNGVEDAHYTFTQTSDTALIAYFKPVEKDTLRDTTYRCENDFPFYWSAGQQMIDVSGTFHLNIAGALTVQELTVYYLPVDRISDGVVTICEGETFEWRGRKLTENGVYFDTLTNLAGCDSIRSLTLAVTPKKYTTVERSLCEGETVVYRDVVYDTPGIYVSHLASAQGCDSVVTLNIELAQSYVLTTSVECFKGTVNLGGAYGTVDIERSGTCDNMVVLTATATDPNYHFSHWRLGKEQDAPALVANPLEIELTADLHIRVIIYDNDRTDINQVQDNNEVYIYDVQGRLLRHGNNLTTRDMQRGMYIVKSAGGIHKEVVVQ